VAIARRSVPFLLGMALYNLGVNYVWISYNSIILPNQVESLFPVQKALVVGIVVSLSTTAGIILNIFSGVLSDNIRLGWGRRWPYIFLGAVFTCLALLVPALLPLAVFTVVSGYLMMQVFTNLSAGSYQPLLPDIIQENQRGQTSGFQGLMTLIGSAMGFGLTGYLVGIGQVRSALVSMSVAFLFTALLTIRTIRRSDRFPREPTSISVWGAAREIFRPKTVVISFFWLVLGSFLIFNGSAGLTYFEYYYFETILKISNPAFAVAITGLVVLVVAMFSSIVFGYLSDRVGRRNLIIGAAVVAGTATIFIPFLVNFYVFLAVASLVGGPLGIFNSVSYALASDLAPREETGKYMAYSNFAVGGASVVATPLEGALLSVLGVSNLQGFVAIFALSSAFYFVGAAALFKIPRR
jgi:MFS family permease